MRHVAFTSLGVFADNESQGSKQQVVIAGAIAGLVSRYVKLLLPIVYVPEILTLVDSA